MNRESITAAINTIYINWWKNINPIIKIHILRTEECIEYNPNIHRGLKYLYNKYYKLTNNDFAKTKEMKDNYIKINGKVIELSEETARSFKEQLGGKLTYEDILKSRYNKLLYYITSDNIVFNANTNRSNAVYTKQRALQLQAITKLMIVADYFNKEAESCPKFRNDTKYYTLYIGLRSNNIKVTKIHIADNYMSIQAPVYFENKEDCKEAIRILGEDTIKLALTGH